MLGTKGPKTDPKVQGFGLHDAVRSNGDRLNRTLGGNSYPALKMVEIRRLARPRGSSASERCVFWSHAGLAFNTAHEAVGDGGFALGGVGLQNPAT